MVMAVVAVTVIKINKKQYNLVYIFKRFNDIFFALQLKKKKKNKEVMYFNDDFRLDITHLALIV